MGELRRFYFTIPSSGAYDWVIAPDFESAKIAAFEEWAPLYNEIKWLTPTKHSEVKLPTIR
jgi:hypothetical protein